MIGYISVNIDPFLIKFPPHWPLAGIRWYGLIYVISFFIVQSYVRCASKKQWLPLNQQQSDLLTFGFACGAVIGGRLGYCILYDFDQFLNHPVVVFQVWNGGMSSHGGFIGAMVAIGFFSWRYRCSFFRITDLLSTIIPLCLMLGRFCNFINSELVGRITTIPWGMIFSRVDNIVRHPSQLYEAFLEGLLPFIILQIGSRRRSQPGYLTALFLILYSVGRIICECFREPDAPLILNLTRGQFYTLFLLPLGLALWTVCKMKNNPNN